MNRGGAETRRLVVPRLYCIVDAGCFRSSADTTKAMLDFTRELLAGGATLIQYRDKDSGAGVMLARARAIARCARSPGESPGPTQVMVILNDRPDLALGAAFHGVHVGQEDLSPQAARRIIGKGIVGVSTHNADQVRAADATDCDYIAIGPAFGTASKQNPDPVVGLEGVRLARSLTRKPLVAIGGITRQNCCAAIAAGADSVAVIADLVANPRRAVEEFLTLLGTGPDIPA